MPCMQQKGTALYILVAIVVLGFLILIHELGHYFVGRWAGIRVLSFSIGFGPKLVSWKRGETEYAIRLIPLGGYCKFLGEDEEEQSLGSMQSVPPWKRFAMLMAGPLSNLLLAVVGMTAFMMMNGNYVPVISDIHEYSQADESGLEIGDVIREVNGKNVLAFFEVADKLSVGGDPTELTVSRDGQTVTLTIPRVELDGVPLLGITTTAQKESLSIFKSANVGTQWLFHMTKTLFSTLGNLLTGKTTEGALLGPVGTIDLIAQEVQTGWRNAILLIAMLSLNLGIFNLLPIPALDGGRLVFLIYEMIRKKPFPPEKEGMIHLVGIVLLFALMIVLTFKDIGALFK